jgi:hypothetical protein
MPLKRLRHVAAGLVASVAAIAFAPPVAADPLDPIPGNGFFVVGADIAPGLYHTAGSASTWVVSINEHADVVDALRLRELRANSFRAVPLAEMLEELGVDADAFAAG